MTRNEEIFALLLKRSETQMVNLDVQTVEGHSPMWYALFASRKLINSNSFAARLFEKGANANPVSKRLSLCLTSFMTNIYYSAKFQIFNRSVSIMFLLMAMTSSFCDDVINTPKILNFIIAKNCLNQPK